MTTLKKKEKGGMGSSFPDPAGGWDGSSEPRALRLGGVGLCSPTTEAPRPGFLHLSPWKSPKQELGEELLVICAQSHLVCIPPAEPGAARFLGWGQGTHPLFAPPPQTLQSTLRHTSEIIIIMCIASVVSDSF